jgi:hypothetical protein
MLLMKAAFQQNEDLIMLLATRFQLSEIEKQLIKEINEADKLNMALKMVITAETKENTLGVLRNGSPSRKHGGDDELLKAAFPPFAGRRQLPTHGQPPP